MPLQFSGSFNVNIARDELWKIIADPRYLSKIIPDLESLEVKDGTGFDATFKVGVAMIKGSFKMSFKYEDISSPEHLKVVCRGSGLQSVVDAKVNINLKEVAGGTNVDWSAEVNIGGLLAGVGSRLLKSTTEQKVSEMINRFKEWVEKGRLPSPPRAKTRLRLRRGRASSGREKNP